VADKKNNLSNEEKQCREHKEKRKPAKAQTIPKKEGE
jgi:hypothetical protein